MSAPVERPSIETLNEMAYRLRIVPRGDIVPVQMLAVLKEQFIAAMGAVAREPVEGEVAEFVRGLTDHAAANEQSANPALQTACTLLCDAAIKIESLSARLTAPVPEVEAQVHHHWLTRGCFEWVPANLARDLGRLLKEAKELLRLASESVDEEQEISVRLQNRAEAAESKLASAVAAEPTLEILCEMAYQLRLVPRGEGVSVEILLVLKNQFIAAMKAAAAIRGIEREGGGNG